MNWNDSMASIMEGDAAALGIAVARAARFGDPAEVRVRLVLAFPSDDTARWLAALDQLFACASSEEAEHLYRGLSRYPHPELLVPRACEGIRSNQRTLFAAVALDHAYPARWLPDGPWNQMVLKAFFTGCDTGRIMGLVGRANAELSRMLHDYARERRAARRAIDPALWSLARLAAGADLTTALAALEAEP